MNADEAGGIEPGFDTGDGLLLEMLYAVSRQRHIVVLRFHVVEFGHRNQGHARAVAYHEPFEKLLWRSCCGDKLFDWRHFLADTVFGAP